MRWILLAVGVAACGFGSDESRQQSGFVDQDALGAPDAAVIVEQPDAVEADAPASFDKSLWTGVYYVEWTSDGTCNDWPFPVRSVPSRVLIIHSAPPEPEWDVQLDGRLNCGDGYPITTGAAQLNDDASVMTSGFGTIVKPSADEVLVDMNLLELRAHR